MNRMPSWLIEVFVVMLFALLRVGWWFYRSQEQQVRSETEENLLAIFQSEK